MNTDPRQAEEMAFLREVLAAEADAVRSVIDRLDEGVHRAVDLFVQCADSHGSVIVSGLGKSGLIGRKISASLASLGIPSHELHPSEAMHGDLGRIGRHDCLLALSHSGETEEVIGLAEILRQDGIPIVVITGGFGGSTLARLSTVALTLGQISEASDLGLAPTCSTTAALALGDALALATARRRSFTAEDFARFHPGGTLGGLLRPVLDVLRFRAGEGLPVIAASMTVREALEQADRLGRRPGALLAVDESGRLAGIFTDGDLRRLIERGADLRALLAAEVMHASPKLVRDDALAVDAAAVMEQHRVTSVLVVDAAGLLVGALNSNDLMRAKVI
ncbi:MAG: KpsF/GutQ family sugar-phosphate isomerase, partial [Phycisphaerales bacterium]|nr:KpsF/GutQ family sugar-phosphate isomerase [Phycisphaerales bacterium]